MSMFEYMVQGTAWDALVAVHGKENITHTPNGGEASLIDVILGPMTRSYKYFNDGEQEVYERTITANPSDISSFDVDGDKFTIDGITWALDNIINDTPLWELRLVSYDEKLVGNMGRINQRT